MYAPLVSVVIPTKNSSKTLEACLRSVMRQTHTNIETIVVDSLSHDKTVDIARKFGIAIICTESKLLGARYIGLRNSNGKYVMLLDSDQILEQTCIERAIKMVIEQQYDMLCLEEQTYESHTIIQKMFEADRKLVHAFYDRQIDPVSGSMLARFYKRDLLLAAFNNIPSSLLPTIVAHDHAIIYYEAYKISKGVGILKRALWHFEPASLLELWRKNFNYGKSTKELIKNGYYNRLVQQKTRLRKTGKGLTKYKVMSALLMILKAPAYLTGYML